jgi:DNA modification methylase
MKINEVYNMDCLEGMRNLPKGHKYCIVTDPPFNVGYHYNEYDDNKEEGEYFAWLQDICKNLPVVMIHYPEALYKFAFQIRQFPERVVAWVYNSNTPRQHRDIAFFGVRPDFSKYLQPYKNPNDKRIAKRIADGHEGGGVVRLVGNKPNKKREQKSERASTPVPNAGGRYAQNNCSFAR